MNTLLRWRDALRARLIDDWHVSFKLWSVRVSALGVSLYGFLLAFPDQALALWNALPADAQAWVPNRTVVATVLLSAAGIARVLRQQPKAPGGTDAAA